MNYKIEHISADEAELLCRQIITDLPEYFGLPECNEHYALGVRSRINFAAKSNETYVGLLSLIFHTLQTAIFIGWEFYEHFIARE